MIRTVHVLVFSSLFISALGCQTKEEILKKAEEQGQLVTEKKARLIKGIGEGLEKEGKAAGEQLAKGSAQVVRGVESGAVEGFSAMPIMIAESLVTAGVKAERAAIHRDDPKVPQIKV